MGAVQVGAVKAYLRVEGADEDGLIEGLIATAEAVAGRFLGEALVEGSVPAPVAQGVVRLAAHLFTHRDAADEREPPAAIAALWRPYRRMRIA